MDGTLDACEGLKDAEERSVTPPLKSIIRYMI